MLIVFLQVLVLLYARDRMCRELGGEKRAHNDFCEVAEIVRPCTQQEGVDEQEVGWACWGAALHDVSEGGVCTVLLADHFACAQMKLSLVPSHRITLVIGISPLRDYLGLHW